MKLEKLNVSFGDALYNRTKNMYFTVMEDSYPLEQELDRKY